MAASLRLVCGVGSGCERDGAPLCLPAAWRRWGSAQTLRWHPLSSSTAGSATVPPPPALMWRNGRCEARERRDGLPSAYSQWRRPRRVRRRDPNSLMAWRRGVTVLWPPSSGSSAALAATESAATSLLVNVSLLKAAAQVNNVKYV